jgi:hypothetical protein
MPNIFVPTVRHAQASWANLNYYGPKHVICAESMKIDTESFSFIGGHRVRLYSVKGNVHWKIPPSFEVDITSVPLPNAPRRQR